MGRHIALAITILGLGLLFGVNSEAAGPFGQLLKGQDPKHTPVIDAPESVNAGEPFKVTVTVGATLHPSQIDHAIQWIELYAGDVQMARTSFTPTLALPVVTFTIMLDEATTLRVLSQPNHSAAWEATKKINVVKKP